MMNLLQRSLRTADASGANANPSNAASKPAKTSSGVMGGLHNSALGVGSSYSTNDYNYFQRNHYDSHFNSAGGYYHGSGLSSSTALPFNSFDNERLLNQGQSDCQKKHIHHTHQQHSNSQSQRSSAMSSYFDNYANYGKLFPASCLQYLHQHNHIEELIVAQQLFAKLDWANKQAVTVNYNNNKYLNNFATNRQPLKAHTSEFEALSKYTYSRDKQNDQFIDSYTVPIFKSQFGSISATHCPLNYEKNILGCQSNSNDYYRISFLETHIYQAQGNLCNLNALF